MTTELLDNTQQFGPGAMLRKAREGAGLSSAHIARYLNLTEEYILALERDDYTKISGVTFMRGYLRAYARLLNIPSDELINKFNRLGLEDKRAEMSTDKLYGQDRKLFEEKSWLLFSLLALGIIIVGGYWWYLHEEKSIGRPARVITANSQPGVPLKAEILQKNVSDSTENFNFLPVLNPSVESQNSSNSSSNKQLSNE